MLACCYRIWLSIFCYVVVVGGGGLNVRICIFVFVLKIDFIVFVTVCYWDGDIVDQG